MDIITKMKELDKYDLWDDKKCKEAKFDGMDEIIGCDLLKALRQKPSLWQEPLIVTEKCLLFKTSASLVGKLLLSSCCQVITNFNESINIFFWIIHILIFIL